MFKDLFRYVNDSKLKIIFTNKNLNIVNYKNILDYSTEKINILCDNLIIVIKGCDLVIKKAIDNELYITGKINSCEFKYE